MTDMNQYFYMRNRQCYCARCRCRGLTGAAILITLGVLMMLDQFNVVSFHITAPVLLIVWGLCLLLTRTSSTEGHVQPFGIGGQGAPPPSSQDPWAGGRVSPPPTAPPTSDPTGQQPQDDQQVKP